MALRLDSQIMYLKGVGPKLGDLFARKGLKTLRDLFEFYPRAFEDQRAARNIASLRPDDIVSIKATVVSVHGVNMGRSSRKMYDVVVRDASGQIHCKYFRVPYKGYFERFKPFSEVRVVGKVTEYRGRIEFHHPDIRDIDPEEENQDALIPLYTEIEGLATAKIMKLIRLGLQQIEEWPEETLPKWMREKYNLKPRKDALMEMHHPNPAKAQEYTQFKSEAQRRLIFEEFFWLELFLAAKKTGFQKEAAPLIQNAGEKYQALEKSLPFPLTGAQKRVFAEIKADLEKGHPMHRLVQGDVGSGKTLVSFMAAVYAAESGFQSCLMAPTEILAEQHYKNAVKVLEPLGIRLALLVGKTKAAERRETLADLEAGNVDLIIGTHALIEADVKFRSLGLVIIDEQHRFGVEQRGILKTKGNSPHFLVMTATPIPRTLAMTVYGDLDVSIIDEMPPGRSPIQTRAIFENKRSQALQFMLEQLQKGRQAYFVYPLVEESEKIDLKNAVEEYEKLKVQFPKVTFGLLHGKMKPDEKEAVMNQFRRHEIQVLVSTTVIEVGVDVPNANIMIIEHAERFGLSQLHQLRGRVGRGEHKSFCILIMGYAVSEEGKLRTEFMEKTTDGFKISEFDLEMRGPGEFMGTRQSGLPGFKMANLVRDMELLQQAREAAFEVLRKDPSLVWPDNRPMKQELLREHGPAALASIA
ncbi:ATP-dependent DNA helicase RecG [Bdellovibrio sp. SKB1291214]|uniref:ATP-dependent DNA helicase RecG n=1 Tax=Bdellovibrio sp. SKB1291214 TaxID=1732569 RepID=UPI000B517498|nr:ATP-dependent DNA helicase RecG [Bdellovibrio sp. SKB1291214]UYL07723.1 ATP-dependent DNA helicase RecG [Bdellovibrio sp. SKB1291214]